MLSSRSSTACWLSSGTLSLRIDRSTYGRSFLTCRNACSWAQLQPLSLVGLVYTWATLQLDGAAPPPVWTPGAGFERGSVSGPCSGTPVSAGCAAALGWAAGCAAVVGSAADGAVVGWAADGGAVGAGAAGGGVQP